MITKLNPNVIQDGSITAEKLADGIANDIISSLSTQSTLPSLTDYYIGQNAGGRTETYFKKTLQSIGSVFQHELYDKVYLKDGSDPTFGNITAGQLNLSENSGVFYAGGFGLALGVNDCAFLVGEEDGVYYLDAAGNTQTILHSGNIGNYKAGDSDKLGGVAASRYFKGDFTNLISNINADNLLDNACYLNQTGNGSGNENFPHTYSIFNVFTNGIDSRVAQVSISTDGLAIRRKIDSWSEWIHYINTDNIGNYNAGSATKLQTARTLWGQSFDGTGNVSGHFVSKGENGGFALYSGIRHNEAVSIECLSASGTWLSLGIALTLDGNVGIGTTSPTEKLDVTGNVKASGKIQCSDLVPTGVINQLNNNSYIVHNAVSNGGHKMWITDGTGKSISAGSAFANDALNIISDTSLLLGAHLDYNIRVLKANNRIAKVIDSDNYSTLLPYKTPVAISNTYSSNPHNVAMADNTLYIVNENEADDLGCTILSFPTNDGSTPLTCGLLYTTYADSTGEFSCPAVTWSYGLTPMISMGKTYEIWFTSYDGGYSWYGTYTEY